LRNLARMGRIGVGFGGMRERLRQLGGKLEVESSDNGTLIRATLPIDTKNAGEWRVTA
jgi:signal transduction histidine kinase